jgi:hypothetical protein
MRSTLRPAALLLLPLLHVSACSGSFETAISTISDGDAGPAGDGASTMGTSPTTYAECDGVASLFDNHEVTGGHGALTLDWSAGAAKATLSGTKLLASGTLRFAESTTATSFVSAGQSLSISGVTLDGKASPVIVDMTIDSGALTFLDHSLFISLQGSPHAASYFFACQTASEAPTTPAPSAKAPPLLATGTFDTCVSSAHGGVTGGGGSVNVSQVRGKLTASLTSVAAVSGALDFDLDETGTGFLTPGQTPPVLEFSCTGRGTAMMGETTLSSATGVLAISGNTLFINLSGATACDAQHRTMVVCTRGS